MSLGFQLRIVDYNYPFQPGVTLSATSEDPEFPVSNISKYIRSKKFRTTGFFIVDNANKYLDFEDAAGIELTATIAIGNYTPTTLAAAIKSAMQAVGAHTYTVSFSATTGKWTIASNHTYLKLLANTGTNAASAIFDTIGFDTTADDSGDTTYAGARIAIHSYEAVLIDLGAAAAIDTFVLLFDPVSGLRLSSSAVVRIQANATNSWSSPAVDVVVTADTQFNIFSKYWSSDQTYRYWRVKVVDPQNAFLYVELGKIILAKATQLSRLPSNGFKWVKVDRSRKMTNEYGHEYVDSYPLKAALQVSMTHLPYADAKTLDSIFQRVGSAIPLFVVLDPTETLFDKDHFSIYGKIMGGLEFGHRISSYADHQVKIEETS